MTTCDIMSGRETCQCMSHSIHTLSKSRKASQPVDTEGSALQNCRGLLIVQIYQLSWRADEPIWFRVALCMPVPICSRFRVPRKGESPVSTLYRGVVCVCLALKRLVLSSWLHMHCAGLWNLTFPTLWDSLESLGAFTVTLSYMHHKP